MNETIQQISSPSVAAQAANTATSNAVTNSRTALVATPTQNRVVSPTVVRRRTTSAQVDAQQDQTSFTPLGTGALQDATSLELLDFYYQWLLSQQLGQGSFGLDPNLLFQYDFLSQYLFPGGFYGGFGLGPDPTFNPLTSVNRLTMVER